MNYYTTTKVGICFLFQVHVVLVRPKKGHVPKIFPQLASSLHRVGGDVHCAKAGVIVLRQGVIVLWQGVIVLRRES